jgi:hypothetical protein
MDATDKPPDSTAYKQPDSTRDGTTDNDEARWMSFVELAIARNISKASAIKLIRRHGWRRQRDNKGHVRALVPLPWAEGGEPDNPRDSTAYRRLDRPGDREPDSTQDAAAYKEPDSTRDSTAYKQPDSAGFEVALAAIEAAHANEMAALREWLNAAKADVAVSRDKADQAEATAAETRARYERAVVVAREQRRAVEAMRRERNQALVDADLARGVAQEAVQAAEALQASVDELKVGQAMMQDMHASELAAAQHDAQAGQQAAAELRRAEAERKARGRWARLRAAWRGE